jgi:hypothetical protein
MTTEFTLGDVLHESRPYVWIAGLAFLFGLAFLIAELLSPDLVIWTGRCVPASFDGGVAHYTVAGQQFTADNPPLVDRSPRTVTVCYYASTPANGYIVHPGAYWVAGGLIGGPFALALVLVAVGILRGARRLRATPELPPLPRFRSGNGTV